MKRSISILFILYTFLYDTLKRLIGLKETLMPANKDKSTVH